MSKSYFIYYIYHNHDYLDYLNAFGLMFSLYLKVKLRISLHCEVIHIQRFHDEVPFLDELLIFYFKYSTNHICDKAVSKLGCCHQP